MGLGSPVKLESATSILNRLKPGIEKYVEQQYTSKGLEVNKEELYAHFNLGKREKKIFDYIYL